MRGASAPPEIVVEGLTPGVDDGRHAVKRIVGDLVEVRATAYREGHDLLEGALLHRGPGDRKWSSAPMIYERDFDRLRGSFPVERVGEWRFTVEVWTDVFGSWRVGFEKKVAAEQDVALELLEGAILVEAAAERAKGKDRRSLSAAAALLRDERAPAGERAAMALDPEIAASMALHYDRSRVVRYEKELPVWVDRPEAGFAAWYEMFPRSWSPEPGRHGTFRDAAARLPEIARMGFDVLYLPPIHPIGHAFRKGRNNSLTPAPDDVGSPWAIGSAEGGHTSVHPDLGTGEDFRGFVSAARDAGLEVALDYALQCSPDHPWVAEHPNWFHHRPDGSIQYAENPPKKYQDIYPIDFASEDREALWAACRDVFFHWIGQGVRIFRVDNPHTKPFAFWEWVIAEVRKKHPDVLFLSEAFTRPARMYGLAKLGFTQSYTYFTWRNAPREIREYLEELTQTEVSEFFRPNFFVNTPDILHEFLQHGGPGAFRIRLALAATLSPLYGVYSGFELFENVPLREGSEEYRDSEKYQVVDRRWDAVGNLKDEIARLNRIRRENPALQKLTNLEFLPSENEAILFYRKSAPGNDLLVAITTTPTRAEETMVHVPTGALGIGESEPYVVRDLLTGIAYTWQGRRNYIRLDAAAGQAAHVFAVERRDPRGGDA